MIPNKLDLPVESKHSKQYNIIMKNSLVFLFLCLTILGEQVISSFALSIAQSSRPITQLCQQKCLTCKASEGGGGGKPLGSSGYCENYCSKWGYCGWGDEYFKDGSDCTGC